MIVTLELGICLEKLQAIEKESKKPLTNMIVAWKELEKKLDVKEKKKHLNNMIAGWKKLKKKQNEKREEETPDQRDRLLGQA